MAKAEQLRAYQEALRENEQALREYQEGAGKSAQEAMQEYQKALREYEAAARKSAEENNKALKEYQAVARKLAEAASNRANEDTGVLRLAHFVRPTYPPQAKKDRVEGNVVLDATVDKQGNVTNIRVIDGPELLVKAALDAVKEWKYEPPAVAPVHTTVTVNFVLDTPPPAGQDKPGTQKR